jgi:hypothetical protein
MNQLTIKLWVFEMCKTANTAKKRQITAWFLKRKARQGVGPPPGGLGNT